MWESLFFRYFNRFDQIYPIFPGWLTISCQLPKLLFLQIKLSAEPVKYIYNPNRWKLQTLTLSMSTWYMLYLQSITAKVNIKYTKISLDVGSAVNVFKEFKLMSRNILKSSPSYWRLSLLERKLQDKL